MSDPVPYLGSKISLISKSQIRYEGILYTIDTKDSTVALARVRSFGTEDRPTDRPVAPRDEVYEYIIFRSTDIKDLHVCEPPKPQPTLTGGLPNDPAIVQHSAPVTSTTSYTQNSTFSKPPVSAVGSNFGPVGSISYQQFPGAPPVYGSGQTPSQHSDSRSGTPSSRKSPTADTGVQASEEQQRHLSTRGLRAPSSRPSNSQARSRPLTDNRSNIQNRNTQQYQQQQQQRGNRTGVVRRGRGQRGRPGSAKAGTKQPLKFENDYDFEQANAEFQELENKLAKTKISDNAAVGDEKDEQRTETPTENVEVEEEAVLENPVCYDKAKSFFDSISCEAVERSKGSFQRPDWRHERKLNTETFGVSGSYMRRGYYRGGRGGFRGNRGYRGGRGYYRQGGSGQYRNNRDRRRQETPSVTTS